MADFKIRKTKVIAGIEGKMMLIHSNSVKCGKTTVGSQMPKPLYLRLEQGANAIDGMDYVALENWADLKKLSKWLTSKRPQKMEIDGKEVEDVLSNIYTTIIFDTFDVAIRWCTKYVCQQYGVNRLKDGNDGFGLWAEYANEWFDVINPILNAGYFIYGISHSEIRKIKDGRTGQEVEKFAPKGDKRTIDLVIETVDFIGYVKSNGVDDNGKVVPSSIYFAETDEYLAGSRFEYMPSEIKVFSAENIQNAIKEAVMKKEQETGNKAITFTEKKESEKRVQKSYEELIEEATKYGRMAWKNNSEEAQEILDRNLFAGAKITDATKKQIPQLEMIVFELKELVGE
ncbi:MAG: AAA family ATPase [Prevotellaceae bacterium]|nr:AAA family ATPase [Candidatus Colivivens equi]